MLGSGGECDDPADLRRLQVGNCLKVKWTAAWLGIPGEWIEIDILEGESRTPEFLAMNPADQVPVVEIDDGRTLAQSNAILLYLADGSALIPTDAYVRATSPSRVTRSATSASPPPNSTQSSLRADIALVAYTRVSHEGGIDLAEYPRAQGWVRRAEARLRIGPAAR